MKKIIYILGMLIISAVICFAQDEEDGIFMGPAWDIHITCTDYPPDYCPPNNFFVYATAVVNGVTYYREMEVPREPDGKYFVVFQMGGMPSHNPDGSIVNYTIMVSPCGSQKVLPYPGGSVGVYMTGSPNPC
ncbi:MAG: hypothetical protein Q8K98_14590 [Bacteroidota bacterium]|nr:hypothetical protein [Bacteroidota bacterium]